MEKGRPPDGLMNNERVVTPRDRIDARGLEEFVLEYIRLQ